MDKEKPTNADFESIDPYEFKAPYFICMEHLARYVYAAYILKRKRVKTVLDIACGCGYGSRELALEGMQVTGLDYSEENIGKANERYSVEGMTEYFSGNINAREHMRIFNGHKFDAAVCFETLEHIQDPEGFLNDLHTLVNDRGYLFISIPDGGYEPLDATGKIRSRYHLHAFSENDMEAMTQNAGFKILRKLYQPDSAGLHRSECRAVRDTVETYGSVQKFYNKDPDAARILCRIFAWPVKERGESYSNILMCTKV